MISINFLEIFVIIGCWEAAHWLDNKMIDVGECEKKRGKK